MEVETKHRGILDKRRARSRITRTGGTVLALATLALAVPAAHAQQPGDYTQAQAQRGAQVFSGHCAECHGVNLQGQAGPALAGNAFKGSLEFSKMSATQLFHFISTQMPNNAPGSLKQLQYEDVLAFILSKNGYPAGDVPLSPGSLTNIKLLPYPKDAQTQSANQ
ncbi:MAG: c-type cytochrome [Rhodanobacteraceae bacterium]